MLVPFHINHARVFARASQDPLFLRFLQYLAPLSLEHALLDACKHLHKERQGKMILRSIEHHGRIVGKIGASKRKEGWVLWYWIIPSMQGKGIGTKAVRDFLKIFPHNTLTAYADHRNTASLRVLQKCGFCE